MHREQADAARQRFGFGILVLRDDDDRRRTDRHAWWVFGLPWSLFAGSAFWGLAGLLGAFDPGRARILRFAAIVFGGALLVWTASIIDQIAETDALERKASEVHR